MLSGFLHKAAEVQPGWFPAERWPRRARKTHELIIVNSLFQSVSNYVNLRKKEEDDKMEELLGWIEFIEETADSRQQSKVRHRLKDIIVIVLFAMLANADDWVEIGIFATYHEEYLRTYIRLENGVPSHDRS